MAAKHKLTKAEKKAKEIDVSDIDNKSVADFATTPSAEDIIEQVEAADAETIDNPDQVKEEDEEDKKSEKKKPRFGKTINIYLLLFIGVLVVAIFLIFYINRIDTENQNQAIDFEGTSLDQETVNQLLSNETNVGTVDQTLTVAANAIFNGKILVKDNLDVAGTLNVGGPLSLPGITVAGDSSFDNVQVDNSLSILGSATIEQDLSIQQDLNVTGNLALGGSFSASNIVTDSIAFSGDLNLSRHINTNGGVPSSASGASVGGGGTVSVSGNDIRGNVTINTGGSPSTGILAAIGFSNSYSSTPTVVISPTTANSASLDYYVSRTASGFSIGTNSTPGAGQTFSFDYFVIQ